ncbi:MAG: diguanylate cyclase [Candidatus Kapabacteria bacterium]|nr:diguanylate cyclase [Candidatus Kapabacteria bacterium]
MATRKVDLRKILQPSDATALGVILIGLFIALFLDEMAVRLIGVCIAILGGVALFMIISPRIAELSIEQSKRRRVSQPPDMSSDTKQDATGVRIQFRPDEYRQSFGSDEGEPTAFIDDRQGLLFDDADVAAERRPRAQPTAEQPDTTDALIGTEIGDGDSGIRIVGVRKAGSASRRAPELVISARAARGPAVSTTDASDRTDDDLPPQRAEPARKRDAASPRATGDVSSSERAFVTGVDKPIGPITEETQLSEDVIVRPKRKLAESSAAEPTASAEDVAANEPAGSPTAPAQERYVDVPKENIVESGQDVITEKPDTIDVPVHPHAPARSIPITVQHDDDDGELLDQTEPRKEFEALLNRVLQVIRSMVNARTAAFFWVNLEKQQLVVEAKITDAGGWFTDQRKIPLGDDVVSQIAIHGRPEILTSIRATAEPDLLPYYTSKANTVSFIGVPVYFGGSVVGVLCADSTEEDAYDTITVGFFGTFTKLISGLIQSYTGKYDLLQSARTLDTINAFRHSLRERGATPPGFVKSLMQAAVQSMDIATIGVVLFDAQQQQWAVNEVRSVHDGYTLLRGATVSLERSCVGRAIAGSTSVVSYGDQGLLRVAPGEPSMDGGQLVAVPVMSLTNVYGALFIENDSAVLTHQDIDVLEALGEHAGSYLEQIYTSETLQSNAVLDDQTSTMNRQGFLSRLNEEFARSVDYQTPFTLCLVQIDGYPSPNAAEEEHDVVLQHVLNHLRDELRTYDLVGRIDQGLVAIGLVSSRAQQAQIWAERMRREIASSILEHRGRRFSVTVSAGVAEADPQDSWETLLENTYHVLRISEEHGNKVTVFA